MTLKLQKVDIFLHALCYIAKKEESWLTCFVFMAAKLESDKLQHNLQHLPSWTQTGSCHSDLKTGG